MTRKDSSQISVAPSQAELILLLETVSKCDHKMAEILKDGWKLKRMTLTDIYFLDFTGQALLVLLALKELQWSKPLNTVQLSLYFAGTAFQVPKNMKGYKADSLLANSSIGKI